MKHLAIFGASTLAKLAHYHATREMHLAVDCFVVDDRYKSGNQFLSLPVLGWSEFTARHEPGSVLLHVAIGYRSMRARAAAYEAVLCAGHLPINIVSSAAYVADDVVMGHNNLIMAGAVIESGVSMMSNNVVWSNVTICHDGKVGSHNFLAANVTVGGEVQIGDGNFLGFSSVVMQGRKIGNQTLIGAQSLVRRDTQDLHQYLGIPARTVGPVDSKFGIRVD